MRLAFRCPCSGCLVSVLSVLFLVRFVGSFGGVDAAGYCWMFGFGFLLQFLVQFLGLVFGSVVGPVLMVSLVRYDTSPVDEGCVCRLVADYKPRSIYCSSWLLLQ